MGTSTTISALDVAKYFLAKGYQEGDLITNLKMQKLLYYAQAWYLVNYGEPLFVEQIEAWNLGPVVKQVYDAFKRFGAGPIAYYEDTEGYTPPFSPTQIEYLDEFYDKFIAYPAHVLVNASHNEAPWKEAMEGDHIISNERMRDFYSEKLKSNSAQEGKA